MDRTIDFSASGRPDAWLEALVNDLVARLRAVCRDWDQADFETLVRDMARTKARWVAAGYLGGTSCVTSMGTSDRSG